MLDIAAFYVPMQGKPDAIEDQRAFSAELVEQAFFHLPGGVIANILISLLLVVVLWTPVAHPKLLGWLALIWSISLGRILLLYRYRRTPNRADRSAFWVNLFNLGVLATGVAWGATGMLLFSDALPQYNVFLAFALGGMVSGATTSMAALKNAARLYIVLLLAPIIVKFFAAGGEVHVAMGAMTTIYGGIYLAMSADVHRTLLTSLRLRQENRVEISERRKAESELRHNKVQLEEIVKSRTAELQKTNRELEAEIAERTQVEKRLLASEDRFRGIVESISDWIWEVDVNAVYTYSSPRVEDLLGYTPQEVIGQTPFAFMPASEAVRVRSKFENAVAHREPFGGWENTNRHKDGRQVVLESSGEPIFAGNGTLAGYRGVDRDITDRKHNAQEIQRIRNLESLGLLAGGIAHDFNNLLTAVFGNIELARLGIDRDSRSAALLTKASGAIDQVKQLTGQLLTFAKGGDPVKKTIVMADLIAETCRFVLSGAPVKYEYEIAADLKPVDVDRGQMWQVLQNLLLNAVEAMPGGGTVRIRAENIVLDERTALPVDMGDYIKITVSDEGRGIPSEHFTRVFDPYFSTKARGRQRGTGLGLTICHSIIKKHNGHITLESSPGQGTTIAFYLPVSHAARHPEVLTAVAASEPRTGHKRILLMEDEEVVIQTAGAMLDYLDCDCEVARNGQEAIDLYIKSKDAGRAFDLVILDLTIRGGMGGEETVRKLKEMDPKVRAVVASGYTDDRVIAYYADFGFTAAITKPYQVATLREVLEKLQTPNLK